MRCRTDLPFYLLVLFALLLSACGGRPASEAPAPSPAEPPAAAEPGVPLTAILDAARGEGAELSSVLGRLRTPRRLDAEPVQNRHDPSQTDTVRTYVYDGLQFSVYHVSAADAQLMTNLEVTGRGYETADGLRVGSTRTEVEAALGAPDERRAGGSVYVYESTGPTPNPFRVRFERDAVAELQWEFYVD